MADELPPIDPLPELPPSVPPPQAAESGAPSDSLPTVEPVAGDVPYVLVVSASEGVAPASVSPLALPEEAKSLAPGFGFWAALGLLLLMLLAQIPVGCVAGVILTPVVLVLRVKPDRESMTVVGLALADLTMIAFVWLRLRGDMQRTIALRSCRLLHWSLALLLTPALIVVGDEIAAGATQVLDALVGTSERSGDPLSNLFAVAPPAVLYLRWIDEHLEAIARLPWPAMLLIGALLPGVAEEFFFRGFLGRGLVARYGPLRGVLATSFLFAIFHVDPVMMCYTLPLGAALHALYLTTRSLWPSVLVHVLFNSVGFGKHKLMLEETLAWPGSEAAQSIQPFLLGTALVAGAVLFFLLFRTRTQWVLGDGQTWQPGYATAEMPPVESAATVMQPPLPWQAALAALALYLAFAGVLTHQASLWFDRHDLAQLLGRGRQHFERGEHEQALACFNQAIRHAPSQSACYTARADAYRQLGKYHESLADFDRAIELAPRDAVNHAGRGDCRLRLGDPERALADCNRAIQLDPRLAMAYSIRGTVHDARREYDRAVQDWTTSLDLERDDPWTHYALAWHLATCQDLRRRNGLRAVEHARRACELTDWKNADYVHGLAAAYAQMGNFDQAVSYELRALELASAEQKESMRSLVDWYRQGRVYPASDGNDPR